MVNFLTLSGIIIALLTMLGVIFVAKKYLKISKKNQVGVVGVIGLLLGAFILAPMSPDFAGGIQLGTQTVASTQQPSQTSLSGVSCPDTLSTNVIIRAKDTAATTLTWQNSANAYVIGKSNEEFKNTTTTSTSPGYTGNLAVTCGQSYKAYVLTTITSATASGIVGGESAEFVASGSTYPITIDAPTGDILKAKVKDAVRSDVAYMKGVAGETGVMAGNITSAGFLGLNMTINETDAGATIDTGSDGNYDFIVAITTNQSSGKHFGGQNGECLLAVDANSASWAEPAGVKLNGLALQKVDKSQVDGKTANFLSAYEYLYSFKGGIGTTISYFEINGKAASGVDPAAADDFKMRWLCKGYFVSVQNSNQVLYSYVTDAGSPVEVLTLNPAQIVIDEIA